MTHLSTESTDNNAFADTSAAAFSPTGGGVSESGRGIYVPDDLGVSTRAFGHKPELLAPAGGMEQLEYAVHFGADAVYLACDRFGLRRRAANFSFEDISRAVEFAHQAGVKVYVTLNASMDGEDVQALPSYLERLDEAGVDALIISDLGAVRLARRHAPSVAIHISTQASCMNAEAACMWHELGAKRIVCAREMSVADIVAMRREIPEDLELEVFVHGAMCMAVSGRCLISDYLNGRSANKGHCTQPCRWGYALVEKTRPNERFDIEEEDGTSFIMSSKDLNMLHHLDDLVDAGVNSIKIEGRVKKAYYVATVVNAYRQVLDGADSTSFDRDLEAVSHRPYSTGFFYGPAEQAPAGPEYAQTHVLAGTVESVGLLENKPNQSGGYDVRIKLRNRFSEGDTLEVLTPGEPVRSIEVTNLRHIVPPKEKRAKKTALLSTITEEQLVPTAAELEQMEPQSAREEVCSKTTAARSTAEAHLMVKSDERFVVPVEVADRAMNSYIFWSPLLLQEKDILRIQTPSTDLSREISVCISE